TAETGRLHRQRDVAFEKLNEIPGVSVTKAQGALYAFPRLDPNVYEIHDDTKLMLDILRSEKILMVHGTGFNWPTTDHFRIVTLPKVSRLEEAIARVGNFLVSYQEYNYRRCPARFPSSLPGTADRDCAMWARLVLPGGSASHTHHVRCAHFSAA